MQPEQQERLFTALGRIEQKVDGITDTFQIHVADDKTADDKHDERLTKLERVWLKAAGALAVGLFVAEAAIAYVTRH